MDWMVHDPSENGMLLSAINNNSVVIANGSKLQIWNQNEHKRWNIVAE
jgi:hypothetical protein